MPGYGAHTEPYSDEDEVKNWLLSLPISVGGGILDTVSVEELERWQFQADQMIDGRLSATYIVPLVKVKAGGAIAFYPPPIPMLAAKLSAYLIATRVLTGLSGEAAQMAAMWWTDVEKELTLLTAGEHRPERILMGHYKRLRGRNRFMPPSLMPSTGVVEDKG